MDKSEKALMIKIAKKLDEIELDVIALKAAKQITPINKTSEASDKFFGINPKEPSTDIVFAKNPSEDVLKEVKRGEILLRKAIKEFCDEFNIQKLVISYE